MAGTLDGRVALVTGGSTGIGKASALAFAREGARVVVGDTNAEEGKRTVDEIVGSSGEAWLEPVQISAATVIRLATDHPTIDAVSDIMEKLSSDDYLDFLKGYYKSGQSKFGRWWHYADLLTVLHAASSLLMPRNFLEIGVRRGRSLAVVSSVMQNCKIYGFDMWVADYAGMPNPGPEFVTQAS